MQQGSPIPWRRLVVELDDVLLILTDAINQLAAGPCALLPGQFDPRRIARALVPDQLVDRAQHAPDRPAGSRAQSDRQIAADAEAGDRCVSLEQVGDAELVDVAADEHLGLA